MQLKDLLENNAPYLCDYHNAEEILDELILLLEDIVNTNMNVLGNLINSFSQKNLSTVLQRTISCLVLIEWSKKAENRLPFIAGCLGSSFSKKEESQLSLFELNTWQEERLPYKNNLTRFFSRKIGYGQIALGSDPIVHREKQIGMKDKLRVEIEKILKEQPNQGIIFLWGYIYSLTLFLDEEFQSLNKKQGHDIIKVANKALVVDALLYLVQVVTNSRNEQLNALLNSYDNKELLWIRQKSNIISQEAIEIDNLVSRKIDAFDREKKKKDLETFLEFAFNKYDSLYKALS